MAPARLDGRTVVVTRGKSGEDALSARLLDLGAAVRELPSIAIAPPASVDALDGALKDLGRFTWAVFASANAVEKTLERMAALEVPRAALARLRLGAVGPATADKLAREVRTPDFVPAVATGAAMAAALAPAVRGARILVPRPAEGRPELVEGLAAAGAEVVSVEAYRTVPADARALRPLAVWIEAREIDAVAFASPSALKAVVAAIGADPLRSVVLAAIGPTTADALREARLEPGVVPERHTGRDLAEAIAARLGPR